MKTASTYPLAQHDARVIRWGLPGLALLTAFTALPLLVRGVPSAPWPLFVLVVATALRLGLAVFRQACGMNPLAWLLFKLAGDDPAEMADEYRRQVAARKRLEGSGR